MKKNYIRPILFIIIILLICTIILILEISNKKDKKQQDDSNKKAISMLDENIMIPDNSYIFFGKYVNGEIPPNEIYETIYKFSSEVLPNYYKKLKNHSEKDIMYFYLIDKNVINKYINVSTGHEFLEFIKLFEQLDSENLVLENMEFLEDGITYNKEVTNAKIAIKYKDNEKVILNIKVYKHKQPNNRNIVFYREN